MPYEDELFEIAPNEEIVFDYVNWRGEHSYRRVQTDGLYFGSNKYHKEPQWLLHCYDLDKKECRLFALKDMTNVRRI